MVWRWWVHRDENVWWWGGWGGGCNAAGHMADCTATRAPRARGRELARSLHGASVVRHASQSCERDLTTKKAELQNIRLNSHFSYSSDHCRFDPSSSAPIPNAGLAASRRSSRILYSACKNGRGDRSPSPPSLPLRRDRGAQRLEPLPSAVAYDPRHALIRYNTGDLPCGRGRCREACDEISKKSKGQNQWKWNKYNAVGAASGGHTQESPASVSLHPYPDPPQFLILCDSPATWHTCPNLHGVAV